MAKKSQHFKTAIVKAQFTSIAKELTLVHSFYTNYTMFLNRLFPFILIPILLLLRPFFCLVANNFGTINNNYFHVAENSNIDWLKSLLCCANSFTFSSLNNTDLIHSSVSCNFHFNQQKWVPQPRHLIRDHEMIKNAKQPAIHGSVWLVWPSLTSLYARCSPTQFVYWNNLKICPWKSQSISCRSHCKGS